jgi:hypothetical protein
LPTGGDDLPSSCSPLFPEEISNKLRVRKLQDHAQQVQVVAVRHAGQVQVEPGELADVLYVEIYLSEKRGNLK